MKIKSFRQTWTRRTDGRTKISISWAPVGAKNEPMIYFQVTASYLLRDIIIVTTSSTLTNPFILISGDRQEDMKVDTWSPIILLKSHQYL